MKTCSKDAPIWALNLVRVMQDVLVMMQEPVVPMCFLRIRAIGVMHMIDQGEQDDKIIAVHIDDPECAPLKFLHLS
jgi:inorganic pyrophosphatase